MVTRARFRHVKHKISGNPDTVTYSAECTGCTWKIKKQPDPNPVLDACMQHAAISTHKEFRTIRQGLSYVAREEQP